MRTFIVLVAICASVQAFGGKPAPEPFCFDGVAAPTLPDTAVVGVRFVEAPLLSVQYGPIPGNLLHMYHTALLFEDRENGVNYTLEYDAEFGVGAGTFPVLNLTTHSIEWRSDVRYCLTEGILHGKKHWSTQFTELGAISGAQFNTLFAADGFIQKHNQTERYQAMRVVDRDNNLLVDDRTCGSGVRDVLMDLVKNDSMSLASSYSSLRVTSFTLHGTTVDAVDETDPAVWSDIFNFYQEMDDIFAKGETIIGRIRDFVNILKSHAYVYKEGTYFRVNGLHFPYMTVARVPVFAPNTTNTAEKVQEERLFSAIYETL